MKQKILSLKHINAQSLRKKIPNITAESRNTDILAVTETWLGPEDTEVDIPGYHPPFRKDRPLNEQDGPRKEASYGGVALYYKENLICKRREDLEVENLEAVWTEIQTGGQKLLIAAMYKPPKSQHTESATWDRFTESLENALGENLPIFIAGDLNCNLLQTGSKLEEIIENHHLTQLISEATHRTERADRGQATETLIDVIITSSLDLVHKATTLTPSLSNHTDTIVEIKLNRTKHTKIRRKIFDYKRADWQSLRRQIADHNWERIMEEKDVDNMALKWTEDFTEMINLCIPTKEITTNPEEPPWITREVKHSMNQRDKAHKKAKKSNRDEDWQNFKILRNRVQDVIRESKEKNDEALAERIKESNQNDEKLWWKLTKQFYASKQNSRAQDPPLIVEGKEIEDNKEKAEEFNKFFLEASNLQVPPNTTLPEKKEPTGETLGIIEVTDTKVQAALLNLKPNKASGPDNISPRVFKQVAKEISPILTKIFNASLQQGKFPACWKTANVSPIHKKGDRNTTKNFRPISLLAIASKILERQVHDTLYEFLKHKGLLSILQAAYTPGSSTVTQLLEIYHFILSEMDEGKEIRFLFMDVSKAFDRVWHAGLLHKLEDAGIEGPLLSWMKSYLTGRSQRVVIHGEHSESVEITAGVPQGSILGPLMFIFYVNDIINEVNINIRLYADDAITYISYEEPNEASEQLEENLTYLKSWADRWLVSFNPLKTESVTFSRKHDREIPPINFDETIVKDVEAHKHLGLTLQTNGKWTNQIKETTTRANKRLEVLKSLRFRLDRRSLEKLYLSYIRPILEYGDIVWDNCLQQEKENLETLQIEAARVVTGARKRTRRQLLYRDTQWETLAERRNNHKLLMFHKMKHNKCSELLINLIPPQVRERNPYRTRNAENLTIPRCNTKIFKESFIPATTTKWNELEDTFKEIDSTSAFKSKLQKVKTDNSSLYHGSRKQQICLAKLRLQCSNLNQDKYDIGLTDSPMCSCRVEAEDVEHFFMRCTHFLNERLILLYQLNQTTNKRLKAKEILWGDDTTLTNEEKCNMFDIMYDYVISTERL